MAPCTFEYGSPSLSLLFERVDRTVSIFGSGRMDLEIKHSLSTGPTI
ncbi:MAG: hypothetical protein OJF47_001298 [Nitrospira sp.]|nr:MAG: hypothetical protein OJF47_001298 [Nitrospira sp.]